ncbi:unnamed protein product [Bursaphelenchus xylophilus]|uniref:(pine wood nematode) hypothetical protein n=1 Tax=Bursaphelenchus xylophilus TaxID=6326 RepID=A0A1I7SB52_BURXY|nr:unnamed protein product [Bursaphelenchus xylophilus]CAG9131753.1 unnamed protein product [Bursaphelenchus xylophilus]
MYNNVYESPLSRPTSYYAPQMPCYPVPWPPNPDYNQPMPSGHGYYQAPINPTHPNLYPEMVYNEPCGYNPEIYPEMANMTKPRIRPNSVGRKPQRRSVAALQDLQRYFQPPLQRTLPTTPEFSASYFNHPLGTMPRNKRPKHQISAEISATLPNNSRRKSVILPPDESKHNIFHWFKEKMGKNEERAPKKVYTSGSLPRNFALRTNSPKTKSVPRMKKADARPGVANGFNNVFYTQIDPKMRPAQLSPERGRKPLNASPERQRRAINLSPERSSRKLGTAKVDHRRLNSQNLSPERSRRNFQTLSPELSRARNSSAERSRTLPGPENSFYDNHNPMLYGYYNGNDVNSNNGTLSKKRITRYTTDGKPIQMQRNGALDNSTYASGDVPAKPPQSAEILRNSIIDPLNVKQYPKRSSNGQIVPPEPPPDYSDRSDSPASQRRSPSPFSVPPRVRFRFPSADDIHSVKKEEKIVEKVENVPQPKGLWARTFDLKIYKKLRPLIQIRGVKIDEKELAKNEKKRPNPPKNPPATGTAVTTKTSAVPSSQNKPLPTEPANETAKKRSIERFTAAVKETLKNTQTDQPKLADTLHKPASILCSQGSKKRRAPDPPMVPEASYSEPLKPAELDLRTDVLDAEMALKMAENAYMNHYEPNGIAEVGKANLAAENSVNLHNSAGNQKPWESIGNGQNNNKNEHNGTYNSLNTGNHAQPSNFPTENSDYLKFESDIESGRKIENSQESGRTSSLPTSPMVLHDISSLRAKFEADCSNITRIEANSSKMEDYSNPSKNDDQTVIKLKPVIDEGYQEDLTRLPRPLESKVWRYNPSTQGLVQYNEIEPKQPVISLHLDENGNTTTALLTDQYTQNSTQFNGYNDPNSTVTSSFRSTNSNSIPTAQSSANPLIADRGVCYVGGTRIEYFLDRSTGPLVVHYQTKRTVHMGNLVCGGGELPAGNEQEIDVYGSWTNNLPAQGVITDLDYGPGIVQKLRERFARLASTPRTEKDEFSDCTVQKRRFASAEPPSINTQILPKMDPSKLSDGMNSASSTGYSSEESNPSDASEPPKELSKSAPLPNERSRRSQSASHADDDLQKPEIHDPTHVITPIRSLREKFERQSQNSCMNKSVRTVYSPRSSSCHTSVVARYPPRQQSGSRKNSETSTVLTDSGVSSTTSTKNSLPSAKITPKQPLRRLSKPAVPSFATEFSMNSKENEDTKNLAESTGRKPTLPKRTVLAKLEPEQKIVVSPPSPHSSNASTSSGDCPSTKSNEQEVKKRKIFSIRNKKLIIREVDAYVDDDFDYFGVY